MVPDSKVVTDLIHAFYRREVVIFALYILLSIATVVVTILGCRYQFPQSSAKRVSFLIFVCVCAVILFGMRTAQFIPAFRDYKSLSYTVEQNAEIFIENGVDNPLDQTSTVRLTKDNGEQIRLKITHDFKLETETPLTGTVVYTNHAKHIVWLGITSSENERRM